MLLFNNCMLLMEHIAIAVRQTKALINYIFITNGISIIFKLHWDKLGKNIWFAWVKWLHLLCDLFYIAFI